jgi:hypothetical protein
MLRQDVPREDIMFDPAASMRGCGYKHYVKGWPTMSEPTALEAGGKSPVCHLLFRPIEVVQQLSAEYRWEFTRRHPYYLSFWQAARDFHERPSTDDATRLLQQAASLILAGINVAPNTPPPDPREEFTKLGMASVGSGWQNGAVAPAMIRTFAHMLLVVLPKEERSQLGRLLNESAEYDSNDKSQMYAIHQRLANLSGEVWDSFPDAPIVSINLQASQRSITEALETLVRRWKQERGIPEMRRRDDKLDEYLTVWDLREGWAGGAYDGSREKTFKEITAELKVPLQTVVTRYQSAFKILTGHDYRPELWIRLFGPIKLSRLNDPDGTCRLSRYRPWRSRNLRPVAESVLLPGRREGDDPKFLACAGITPSDVGLIELQIDVQTLIERGDADNQIQQNLDPDRELREGFLADLIAELRSRQ